MWEYETPENNCVGVVKSSVIGVNWTSQLPDEKCEVGWMTLSLCGSKIINHECYVLYDHHSPLHIDIKMLSPKFRFPKLGMNEKVKWFRLTRDNDCCQWTMNVYSEDCQDGLVSFEKGKYHALAGTCIVDIRKVSPEDPVYKLYKSTKV